MQPAARIAAAIEVLDEIEGSILSDGPPADRCVAGYMRQRRYIGSKDRRAISGLVYRVLRQRGYLSWVLQNAGVERSARSLVIAELALSDFEQLSLFGGQGAYAPEGLSSQEETLTHYVRTCDRSALMEGAPAWAKYELPDFIEGALQERFGDDLQAAMLALNEEAPLNLRINTVKANQDLIKSFVKDHEDIEISQYSPIGFSSKSNLPLQNISAYRDGMIEVQDEAAQLASYLVQAEPGMTVIDLCAGAGGKSLTLAARMQNQGTILAFDIGERRLANMQTRAKRAGASIIETRVLQREAADRNAQLNAFRRSADRVVVDAPCSGTGTWRRSPDQRWRLTQAQVDSYADLQFELLEEASHLVTDSGRLIYMTCSLLPQENEGVVDRFLDNGNWRPMPWREVWDRALPDRPVPESLSAHEHCLQLAPHKHGTDGFFVAVFERA